MRYWKPIIFVGAILIAIAYAFCASASLPERCERSVAADVAVTARFVTMPDIPPMTAKGSGGICYELGEKGASIVGESVPALIYNAFDPPLDIPSLTVVAEVIVGTCPEISWQEFPKVELTNVDIRVRAYAMKFADVHSGSGALVDIVLSNLKFTTDRIEVEGESAEGFIDAEGLRAVLVGKAVLPDHDFPPYKEWLAGQPVLLELMVRMKNPYQK
jgi:hypothetical protein